MSMVFTGEIKNLLQPGLPLCCALSLSCIWLCDPTDYSLPGSPVHGNSPGKNTRVGCHALQGIFPTQGSNTGLLHCRWILYCLSHSNMEYFAMNPLPFDHITWFCPIHLAQLVPFTLRISYTWNIYRWVLVLGSMLIFNSPYDFTNQMWSSFLFNR